MKRNAKGSPIQKKDEHGKSVYEYVELEQPKLCSSDFWAERGGQLSFGNMQDNFYEQVSVHYGLDRGEVGSNKKHTTKYQWQKAQQEAELAALEDEKVHAEEVIEQAQTAVETRDKVLEELKPLRGYLDAFKEALSGDLPFSPSKLKKMLIGLMTEYKRTKTAKTFSENCRKQSGAYPNWKSTKNLSLSSTSTRRTNWTKQSARQPSARTHRNRRSNHQRIGGRSNN